MRKNLILFFLSNNNYNSPYNPIFSPKVLQQWPCLKLVKLTKFTQLVVILRPDQGLALRNLLIALPFGGILEISRKFVDARRPMEMTPELREEMIIPYIPELPINNEDFITYNQSILGVRAIKTSYVLRLIGCLASNFL